MRLFDHRLIVVLGKGGVGRTTLTAALGLAAAEQGKRACVVEFGSTAALPPKFGLTGRSFAFRSGAPRLDVWSLTVPEALEEFGARKLHLPGFARRVVRNRFVSTFVDAVPGLHDLLLLGKVENLISEPRSDDPVYDSIILDAPATGHGLTLLQAASTMTSITRAGPFYELSHTIEVFLADRQRTGIVVATLPEALPVSETLELIDQLDSDGFAAHTVIANQVEPQWLPSAPSSSEVLRTLATVPEGQGLADLAQQTWARSQRQEEALASLGSALEARNFAPPVRAPFAPIDPPRAIAHTLAAVL